MPGTFTFSKARRFTNAKLKKRNFNNFNISFNSTTTNLSHDREKYEERKKKNEQKKEEENGSGHIYIFERQLLDPRRGAR